MPVVTMCRFLGGYRKMMGTRRANPGDSWVTMRSAGSDCSRLIVFKMLLKLKGE